MLLVYPEMIEVMRHHTIKALWRRIFRAMRLQTPEDFQRLRVEFDEAQQAARGKRVSRLRLKARAIGHFKMTMRAEAERCVLGRSGADGDLAAQVRDLAMAAVERGEKVDGQLARLAGQLKEVIDSQQTMQAALSAFLSQAGSGGGAL